MKVDIGTVAAVPYLGIFVSNTFSGELSYAIFEVALYLTLQISRKQISASELHINWKFF
jgi:hypothetical protein